MVDRGVIHQTRTEDTSTQAKVTYMNDTNTFSEYRQITLPYQRGGNSLMRSTQMSGQQAPMQQQVPPTREQQRQTPAKMPKAQALALLRRLKQGIVVASLLSFGTFGALVVNHTVGTTTSQTSTSSTTSATKTTTATKTPTTTKTTTATSTPTTTKTTTPTSTPTTTSTQQGGSNGFGSNNSASNPVSGTHTS